MKDFNEIGVGDLIRPWPEIIKSTNRVKCIIGDRLDFDDGFYAPRNDCIKIRDASSYNLKEGDIVVIWRMVTKNDTYDSGISAWSNPSEEDINVLTNNVGKEFVIEDIDNDLKFGKTINLMGELGEYHLPPCIFAKVDETVTLEEYKNIKMETEEIIKEEKDWRIGRTVAVSRKLRGEEETNVYLFIMSIDIVQYNYYLKDDLESNFSFRIPIDDCTLVPIVGDRVKIDWNNEIIKISYNSSEKWRELAKTDIHKIEEIDPAMGGFIVDGWYFSQKACTILPPEEEPKIADDTRASQDFLDGNLTLLDPLGVLGAPTVGTVAFTLDHEMMAKSVDLITEESKKKMGEIDILNNTSEEKALKIEPKEPKISITERKYIIEQCQLGLDGHTPINSLCMKIIDRLGGVYKV